MQPGPTVDRYDIERLVDARSGRALYRARDRATGTAVALKIIAPSDVHDARRFAREARSLAALDHRAIARYLDHGVTGEGSPYLVMEWIEGEDLAARLARGPLPAGESVALGARVAGALGEAHRRGIVHRDVKPSNIMLPAGSAASAKLVDFGVARFGEATSTLTGPGQVIGTPGYLSPEQARGEREVDPRADVFSLGCVLFACLTGRPPFVADRAEALLARLLFEDAPRVGELCDVAPELEALVARMLARAPELRPADGEEAARALESLPAEALRSGASRPSALGEREQRFVTMVVIQRPRTTEDAAGDGLARLREAAASHGATLDTAGDGTLVAATRGADTAADQAVLAARCAVALQAAEPSAAISLVTAQRVADGGGPGRASLDQAGSDRARPGAIVLDDATAGLLDARFAWQRSDAGIVLGDERPPFGATRTLLGQPTPFVGRRRELAWLEAIFEECADERVARAVLVTAPAGTGKSRLRDEHLAALARGQRPWLVLAGRGDPVGPGSAMAPIAQAIRREAGVLDGAPEEDRCAALRARVARHVAPGEVDRVAVLLGELAGVRSTDEASLPNAQAPANPLQLAGEVRRAWIDFLAAECAAHPVAILIEDLHWADRSTVKLIDAALDALSDRPLLVLGLGRPEVHELFPSLWSARDAQSLRLPPLPRWASEQIVRGILGAGAAGEVVERIVERSAGNALFLEELCRAAVEGNEGRSDSVLAMVEARIEGFAARTRRVLRAASVLGERFWRGSVEALLGGAPGEIEEQLAVLVERELVVQRRDSRFLGEVEYVFRHGLVRDAAYATLTGEDRALGHLLAAGWLERKSEPDALLLAHHFERGGEPKQAAAWYLSAADRALRGTDVATTVALAERGIACGAAGELAGELHSLRALAFAYGTDLPAAAAAYHAALPHFTPGSRRWYRAATALLSTAIFSRTPADLVTVIRALLEDDPVGSVTDEEGQFSDTVVIFLCQRGELPLARQFVDRVERRVHLLHPAAVAPWARVEVIRYWSGRFMTADPRATLAAIRRALDLYERVGEMHATHFCKSQLGYYLGVVGRWAEAEQVLSEVIVEAGRIAFDVQTGMARAYLGLALAERGAPAEGAASLRQAIEAELRVKNPLAYGNAHTFLARVLLLGGDAAGAREAAREATARLAPFPSMGSMAVVAGGWATLALGRAEEARDAAHEAITRIEGLGGFLEVEPSARRLLAASLLALGDREAALREAARGRDLVLAAAATFTDPADRAHFLEDVEDHARLVDTGWIPQC